MLAFILYAKRVNNESSGLYRNVNFHTYWDETSHVKINVKL